MRDNEQTLPLGEFKNPFIGLLAHTTLAYTHEFDSRLMPQNSRHNVFVQVVIGEKTWTTHRDCGLA
jgi:hypothetical protein